MMRQFVRVVEAGSFSAAARRLNVGQPTLSKTVAQLEAHLGVRLLVRNTRAQSLTDAGRRFYERARIVLDEFEQAEAAARDEASAFSGLLRVAAPSTYAAEVIIPALGDFLTRYPELMLDLLLDDRHVDLVQEGVDCAIRADVAPDAKTVGRAIDHARRLMVATPAYLDRCGSPETPADLSRYPFVLYAPFGPELRLRSATAAPVNVAPPAVLTVSTAEGLRAAVLASLGLAVVSERMVGRELRSGVLVEVMPQWRLPSVDVWALYPAGRRTTAKARAFVDWLADITNCCPRRALPK